MTLNRAKDADAEALRQSLKRMLRSVRMSCGFSQDDIGAMLSVNRATYTNYETGKVLPNLVTVIKLGRIFQIPPEDFLHPDEFVDVETSRQRVRTRPTMDPQKISELSKEEKQMVAENRLKNGSPARRCDRLSSEIERALSQFTIKKTYMGYPFLVSAIHEAVIAQPDRLTASEICELVAAEEETAPQVVSRELKRTVNSIWYQMKNPEVYSGIVGFQVKTKPLPLEFIYTIAERLA